MRKIAPGGDALTARPTAVAPWANTQNRNNHFDGIRLAMALLVVFSHCYDVTKTGATEPLAWITGNQLHFGAFAVHYFFLISGFLITSSWDHSKGLFDFLRKRVGRIYPGFVVACLASALLFAPLATADPLRYLTQIDYPRLVARTAMLRTLDLPATFPANPNHMVNIPLWTIVYEFLCYLMVGGAGVLGILRRRAIVAAAFALALVAFALWPSSRPGALADLVRLTTFFLGGMCFYLYRDRIPMSRTYLAASIGVLLVTTVAGKGLGIAQATCGAYVLFHIAYLPATPVPVARHGDLSYGVYLYGFPVQQFVVHAFGSAIPPATVFAASLVPVALLALMSWRFVEKPCLNLARGRRRPEAQALSA